MYTAGKYNSACSHFLRYIISSPIRTPIYTRMIIIYYRAAEMFGRRYAETFCSVLYCGKLLPSIYACLRICRHSVRAEQHSVDDFGKHSAVYRIFKEYVFGNIYLRFCCSRHIILLLERICRLDTPALSLECHRQVLSPYSSHNTADIPTESDE